MKRVDLKFPAGFRFHPTDEELVTRYLARQCASQPIPAPIVAEIDLYKFDPWDLPGVGWALYGENEWYFFSPRDRKYPNGSRPNRMAGSGYWKATGADKLIGKPRTVGTKKALVFYAGKAPKGDKTNWIMHEYQLADVDRSASKKKGLRLDDWVLCRIYNKKGAIEKPPQHPQPSSTKLPPPPSATALPQACSPPYDYAHIDTSESLPKLHHDSSCSEHATSPEFTSEVQSEPAWKSNYWEKFDGLADNCKEANPDFGGTTWSFVEGGDMDEMWKLPEDIFMYFQKQPF